MGSKNGNQESLPMLPEGVRVHQLSNGLTLILKTDHNVPVVSVQAWCESGSIHEGDLLGAGLSHALEHMLFKGTTTRPPGKIDQEVQAIGGYMNAYTSFDRTVYYIDAPSTGTDTAVDILCDIMQNASIPESELEKEKQVILREMAMNQDDPSRLSGRRLFETAYTSSPYKWTVIGYPDIFKTITRENLYQYYKAHYQPANVFYVIAGDINEAGVIQQIEHAWSGVPRSPWNPSVLHGEPRQTGPREMLEEADIQMGHVHLSWHIPGVRHEDVPALDVLATLLGAGYSSRLYTKVRDAQQLVHSVDAWTYNCGRSGLFGMSAMMDADKFHEAREAMLREVAMLREMPPMSKELKKAENQFLAGHLSSSKTMSGQAQTLGSSWMAARDLNFSKRYLDHVKRLTPDEILHVARKYLRDESLTTYALLPRGTRQHKLDIFVTQTPPKTECLELDNGLKVLLRRDTRLPFAEMRAVFLGGVLCEGRQYQGLSHLLSRVLVKGAGTKSAEEIAEVIESMGGQMDPYSGNNSLGLKMEVLSGETMPGLQLFSEVLRAPSLPESYVNSEKRVQLASIRAEKDHMLQDAIKSFRAGLYGDQGYGLDHLGKEAGVEKLDRAAVQAWYQKTLRPDNAVLAIFGDFKYREVEEQLPRLFGEWPASDRSSLPGIPGDIEPLAPGVRHLQREKQQAVVVAGVPGTCLGSRDQLVLDLIQESCSDLGSRLFLRIREQLGLAYYVGAQHFPGLIPGYFAFYAGTEPDAAEQVLDEIRAEAAKLVQDGLSEDEFTRAKTKILGQRKIARQDIGNQALNSALDELYGLGFNRQVREEAEYTSITREETVEVAGRYLSPERFSAVILSPKSKS